MFDLRLAILLGSVCVAVSTDATAQESQNAFRWVNPLPADRTPLVKHGTYFSRLHDTKVGFYVYLPPGYDDEKKAEQRYPVVYYLHGGRPGGEHKSIRMADFFDEAIRAGRIPPMIYVFVNGGAMSHYDFPELKSFGESTFIQELIPHIDAEYRTIADRAGRALEGFSQGGRGTARIMFKHPELFCSAAPMGGGHQHEKHAAENDGRETGGVRFEPGNNTYDLARKYAEQKDEFPLKILVAFGKKDFNYEANLDWMEHLKQLHIPFEHAIAGDSPHSATECYRNLGDRVMAFHAANFAAVGQDKTSDSSRPRPQRASRDAKPDALHLKTDLLIVGATESGWAAAMQAARLGVKSIILVHDGRWLGGQYTEQALACVDENKGVGKVGWGVDWHPMKRSFHRFGLFKELMDRIESHNTEKYGSPMPGLPFHGPTTFRPAEAEAVFRSLLQPYVDSGQVRVFRECVPTEAVTADAGRTLTGLRFRSLSDDRPEFVVSARLTIDASDWGDVVQLAGAAFEVGVDPQSRYGEPSAPVILADRPGNEMNPITWTMIIEESDDWTPIARPKHFDERKYAAASPAARKEFGKLKWDHKVKLGSLPPWPDAGKAAARQATAYTMRRIVEGTTSRDGRTSILLCYAAGQDYPLERLPRHVVEAIEASEPGASQKNIVLMSRDQRQIVFDDAKQHALGMLYHLQHYAHDHADDVTHSLRKFHLSEEFGTADRLPPKPYIRESLRLKALYMMREQDGRNVDGPDKSAAREAFAEVMYPDGVFAWQFHYDFHDTGRAYLKGDDEIGPWIAYEKPGRGTHTVSDRSVFPLRSLVPIEMNGLIGAQKNLGYSSIVMAAIRLHDQCVHAGQVAGALAELCLRTNLNPRDVPYDRSLVEEVRRSLCGGAEGTPMLLWPFRDLPAEHEAFVAVNRLAARGALPMQRRDVDFHPDDPAEPRWRIDVVGSAKSTVSTSVRSTVATRLENLAADEAAMTRGEFAHRVWKVVRDEPLAPWERRSPGDADGDGVLDVDDPLPFVAAPTSWTEQHNR